MIFGNFGDFWKKLTSGPPGVDILGKVGVQNSEKWGQNEDLRSKRCVLPEFLRFLPHFRVPQGLIEMSHFPKSSKFPKMLMLQSFIKSDFQKVIFFRK